MILERDVLVVKAFNNNILLVKSKGREKILFAKGIGFGRKFGEVIEKGIEVDKIFIIENEENLANFSKIIGNTDKDFLALCEEIIYDISEELKEDLNENIHIALIDHLNFSIKRLEKGEEIQNPFIVEIETLYPVEYDLAESAAKKVEAFKGIKIPDGEIGFIALHIHSARNNGKISNTLKYSYLASSLVECVEDALDVYIDRRSLDYARFLTHVRFAIQRIVNEKPIKNELTEIIKIKYIQSYKIAEKLSEILKESLACEIVEDEIAYLSMHVERFRVSLK